MFRPKVLDNKGFTLIEMLVVITIIGILASIAVPNYMKAKNKAKEAECKSNLHVIQTALERYATDHDGNYPPYLIGGDKSGWMYWHNRNDGNFPNAPYLHDPLVEYGYIDSYPKNPFATDTGSVIIGATGGNSNQPGTGDPRFGMGGSIMGMVVEDPRYYRQDDPADPRDPVIETSLTLPATAVGFPNRYHYMMGGHWTSEGKKVRSAWIGDFFYRAIRETKLGRTGANDGVVKLPDYGWSATNEYYILGVFGAEETRGVDCIRNTAIDSNGNQLSYQTPPESGLNIPIGGIDGINGNGLPELFGGGDRDHGPVWPYNYDIQKNGITEVRFGAPDGVEDGVILVLSNTGNNLNY
jgi:type II secretion system protein G